MMDTCPTCEGRRQVPNTLGIGGNPMLPCSPCGGTGTVPDYNSHAEPTPMFECSDCEGTGKSPADRTQELPEKPEQGEGPYKEGDRLDVTGNGEKFAWALAPIEAEIANAAFAAGRAHIWEQIEKRIYPAPPFDTKDWQTEYECLTADLAEMFLPERGFGDPAEGYREMADESLELSESTLPAAPAPPKQEGE